MRSGQRAWAGLAAAGCVVALAAGCQKRAEADLGTPANPVVVVLAHNVVQGRTEHVEALKAGLERQSGLSVKVEVAPSAVRAIQVFGGGRADVGLLPAFEYFLARQEYGVEAGLQVLREGPTYRGAILVKAEGGPARFEDLAGKRIAYTDPYSMSGFVLPAARFAKAGLEVESTFAGGHDQALAKLLAGKVDAVATYERPEAELAAKGVKVLERTDPVANEPVFFRKGLAPEKREALTKALEALAKDEQGAKALKELAGIRGFARVGDEQYAGLEQLAQDAGVKVQSLVPGGWFIFNSNRADYPFGH